MPELGFCAGGDGDHGRVVNKSWCQKALSGSLWGARRAKGPSATQWWPHEQLGAGSHRGAGTPPPDITLTLLHQGWPTNKLWFATIMGPSNRPCSCANRRGGPTSGES